MAKRDITAKQAGQEVAGEIKKAEKAVVKRERVKMTPPPPPPVKLGETMNPIIEKKGLKRALAVAIVKVCTHQKEGKPHLDEIKAARMIRTSGILYKAGYTEEKATDPLTQSEWTGGPYMRFVTNTADGKVYATKHEDKVKVCEPFAKALKHAVDEALKVEKEKEKVAAPEATPAQPVTA